MDECHSGREVCLAAGVVVVYMVPSVLQLVRSRFVYTRYDVGGFEGAMLFAVSGQCYASTGLCKY